MPEGRGFMDRTTMAGHTASTSCRHWPERGTGASTGTLTGASPGPGSGGDVCGFLPPPGTPRGCPASWRSGSRVPHRPRPSPQSRSMPSSGQRHRGSNRARCEDVPALGPVQNHIVPAAACLDRARPRGSRAGSDTRDAQEPEPQVAALSEDHWKHMASAPEDGRCDLY